VGIFSDPMLLYTFNSKVRAFYETFSSGTFNIEIFPGGVSKSRKNHKRCNFNKIFMSVFQKIYIGSCIRRII